MKTCYSFPIRKIPLLILALVTGCSKPPVTDARLEPPLVLVSKAAASVGDHPVYTGVVTARVESNIGFRVAGKVIERRVDKGQAVRKGQVLMRLDRNDLVLNYSAQKAAVAPAQAKYTQAIADEARLNGLSKQGAISVQTYDAAKAALDASKTMFKWFERIGLDEEDFRKRVYMAAVCRCFPGKNPKGGDRVPSPGEIGNCAGWLQAEIGLLKPDLILPIGKLAIGKLHSVTFHGHRTEAIPFAPSVRCIDLASDRIRPRAAGVGIDDPATPSVLATNLPSPYVGYFVGWD